MNPSGAKSVGEFVGSGGESGPGASFDVSRRALLGGAAIVLPGALVSATNAKGVVVYPTTPEHAVVVAKVATGKKLVAWQGSTRREQKAAGGVAVLGLPVSRNARSKVTVRIEGAKDVKLDVDTRTDSLRGSLMRVANKRINLGPKDEPRKIEITRGVVVDARVKRPLEDLIDGAAKAHVGLVAHSGYRSFESQRSLYQAYSKRDGAKEADTYSARPGHSEHQLGLAVDLGAASGENSLKEAFGSMREGKWVADNAHRYGFIIRYPKGAEKITGYHPEPWHLRYVGKDVAMFLHERRDIKALEQLFDLKAAPDY